MASKTQRVIEALREAADAYRDLPDSLKRPRPLFGGGYSLNADQMEAEANYIEAQAQAVIDASKDPNQGALFDGN